MEVPEEERVPSFSFDFYGRECGVPLSEGNVFRLRGIDGKSVAAAWRTLSSGKYLPVVYESLQWRDRMNLCDWGYIRFLDEMTKAFSRKHAQRGETVAGLHPDPMRVHGTSCQRG